MPQHKATCARKYWRKIEQHPSLIEIASVVQGASQPYSSHLSISDLSEGNVQLPDARDETCTLRIVPEMTLNLRLAADALARALVHFKKTNNVESYKAALVTAFRLNINIEWPERLPDEAPEIFLQLSELATAVDQLVRGNTRINDLVDHGELLHRACAAGVAEILEPLFWRGARFDVLDTDGYTPLESAIESGDIDTVLFALTLGSDPNQNHPLLAAYEAGRHDIMTLLVEYGADVNYSSQGQTLLGLALEEEIFEEVRFVLSLGADPNVGDWMWELLESCVVQGCSACFHEDLALLLMEQDVTLLTRSKYGYGLLHYAADGAHARLLRAALNLITSRLILDGKDESGSNALHYAAGTVGRVPLHQTIEVVSMLLEAGADINARNAQGATALKIAAEEGSDKFVQLLLDAGAMVRTPTYHPVYWETALSSAADGGHGKIVGLLLENAPPTHEDSPSLERALRNAVRKDHGEIVKQLLLLGSDIVAGDILGLALERSSAEVVQVLLDAGARLDDVRYYPLRDLFKARTEDAQEDRDDFFEAPLKCELLVRAFPYLRELYM
jgi:ankyrin repeat protein